MEKKKYTVFFDQRIRINYQVLADSIGEAKIKGIYLFKKNQKIPIPSVMDGWAKEDDGEDT